MPSPAKLRRELAREFLTRLVVVPLPIRKRFDLVRPESHNGVVEGRWAFVAVLVTSGVGVHYVSHETWRRRSGMRRRE